MPDFSEPGCVRCTEGRRPFYTCRMIRIITKESRNKSSVRDDQDRNITKVSGISPAVRYVDVKKYTFDAVESGWMLLSVDGYNIIF